VNVSGVLTGAQVVSPPQKKKISLLEDSLSVVFENLSKNTKFGLEIPQFLANFSPSLEF